MAARGYGNERCNCYFAWSWASKEDICQYYLILAFEHS